ncbi:MAG: tyrosine-type recombinase/integrase, partial [Alphaproteobacteria bacterium]
GHSLRAYRQDLIAFSKFAERVGIKQIPASADIIAYQKTLREAQKLSPATIRRRLITLRSYFAWLCETEKALTSPFNGLRLDMKIPKRLPRPVDRVTLETVFRSGQNPNITFLDITRLIIRLLVVTGLRIGELTSLKVGDVTAEATQIRVCGKGNKERTVYITNDKFRADFYSYWKERYDTSGSKGWLFLNLRGEQLTPQTYRKRLKALSKSLMIEPALTPHQFRHSAATLLIEEGVDIRFVQRLLGHASIATTEIYTKVSDNALKSAITMADTLSKIEA